MARQLALLKRTTLDGYGWDDSCYVMWRPVTYLERLELKKLQLDTEDEAAALNAMLKLIKEHVVSGKVKVLVDGQEKLVDIEPDDIDNFAPELTDRLFADMTGAQFEDPKVSPTVPGSEPAQSEPESSTETPPEA